MGRTGSAKSKKEEDNSFYDKSGNQLWLVEEILDKKTQGGKILYKVKWQGYTVDEATWEPAENVVYIKELIEDFENKHGKGSKPKSPQKKVVKPTSNLQTRSKKIAKEEKPAKVERPKKGRPPKQTEENDNPTDHGGWAHDVALHISDHAILEEDENEVKGLSGKAALSRVLFKVEWKPRKDGSKPADTFYGYNTLKKKCPYLLLDYVENMVHFD